MSAITLAQQKIQTGDTRGFLVALEGLGFLTETVEEILVNEELSSFFQSQKASRKKVSLTSEERQGLALDESKCLARVWYEKPKSGGLGYDNIQCLSKKKVDGECLCKKHFEMKGNGCLWTGLVTESRPEEPVHPTAGPKMWSTDSDGNDVVKEKKPRKTSEKKVEKKSSKKKDDEDCGDDLDADKYTIEELMVLLEQKKDEQKKDEQKEPDKEQTLELEDEGDGFETITAKDPTGVFKEYQLNTDDQSVLTLDLFEPVGVWNKETQEIDFDDDEE